MRLLVLTRHDRSQNDLLTHIAKWNIRPTVESDATLALRAVEQAIRDNTPYQAVIVDLPPLDIYLSMFADATRREGNQRVELIYIAQPNDLAHMDKDMTGFLVLRAPLQSRLLFDALHACLTKQPLNNDVVVLAEQFQRLRSRHPRRRILVAENNSTSRLILLKMLESAGHRVDLVSNGEEALDKLDQGSYDVVIMNLEMPVMDGLDAIKMYRFTHPPEASPPFVVLTTDATTETIKDCKAVGVDVCMAKPIEALRLLETVDDLARGKSHRTETPIG